MQSAGGGCIQLVTLVLALVCPLLAVVAAAVLLAKYRRGGQEDEEQRALRLRVAGLRFELKIQKTDGFVLRWIEPTGRPDDLQTLPIRLLYTDINLKRFGFAYYTQALNCNQP